MLQHTHWGIGLTLCMAGLPFQEGSGGCVVGRGVRRVVEHKHTVWDTVRLVSGVRLGSSLQREERVTETDDHRPSGTGDRVAREKITESKNRVSFLLLVRPAKSTQGAEQSCQPGIFWWFFGKQGSSTGRLCCVSGCKVQFRPEMVNYQVVSWQCYSM